MSINMTLAGYYIKSTAFYDSRYYNYSYLEGDKGYGYYPVSKEVWDPADPYIGGYELQINEFTDEEEAKIYLATGLFIYLTTKEQFITACLDGFIEIYGYQIKVDITLDEEIHLKHLVISRYYNGNLQENIEYNFTWNPNATVVIPDEVIESSTNNVTMF